MQNENKLNFINKNLFLFFFFFFKYYNHIDFHNNINYNFLLNLYNKGNIKFFYYINCFINIDIIKKIKINCYDKISYIYFEYLNKNIFIRRFNYNFFLKKNYIKFYFFFDFFFNIDGYWFLAFPCYMNYFRIFKYNEYLINHPTLYKYPFLFTLIRCFLKNRKHKRINYRLTDEFAFKTYTVYFIKANIIKRPFLSFSKIYIKKFFYKFFFFRFLIMEKMKNLFIGNIFFFNYLNFYLYLIKINHNEEIADVKKNFKYTKLLRFIHRKEIFKSTKKHITLTHLKDIYTEWGSLEYNIVKHLSFFLIKFLYKLYLKNNLYIYNKNILKEIYNSHNINIIILFSNIMLYKIIKFYIMDFLEYGIFIWYKKNLFLEFRKRKTKKTLSRILKFLNMLVTFYMFGFMRIKYNTYNFMSSIKKIKFNIDYVFWNIFFIHKYSFKYYFNYDINIILNKIQIDSAIINIQKRNFLQFKYFFSSFDLNLLIKTTIFFNFFKDFFFKLYIFFLKKKYINFFFLNSLKYNQRKDCFHALKTIMGVNIFKLFRLKYLYFYNFYYEWMLYFLVFYFYMYFKFQKVMWWKNRYKKIYLFF